MINLSGFGLGNAFDIIIVLLTMFVMAAVFVKVFTTREFFDVDIMASMMGIFMIFFSFMGVLDGVYRSVGVVILALMYAIHKIRGAKE